MNYSYVELILDCTSEDGFSDSEIASDDFEVKSYPGLGTKLVIMKELTPLSEEVY